MIQKSILFCIFSCVIATVASIEPPDVAPLALATADEEQRFKRGALGTIEYILYCSDQHPNCSGWAERGECAINPIYMNLNCQDSCQVCHVGDTKINCGYLARRGDCYKFHYMRYDCFSSCFKYGMCQKSGDDRVQKFPNDVVNRKPERRNYSKDPPDFAPLALATASDEQRWKRFARGSIQYVLYCKDQHASCPGWAERSECTINPIWMNLYCQDACKVCHVGDKSLYCGYFARRGDCTSNPDYMNTNCVPSCSRYGSGKRSAENRVEKFFLDVINRKPE